MPVLAGRHHLQVLSRQNGHKRQRNTYFTLDIRDKDGRDGLTPLVVLRERQAVALIKAKDKGLKAIRLL